MPTPEAVKESRIILTGISQRERMMAALRKRADDQRARAEKRKAEFCREVDADAGARIAALMEQAEVIEAEIADLRRRNRALFDDEAESPLSEAGPDDGTPKPWRSQ